MLDAIETNEVNKLWMKLIDSVKLCCASAQNVHNGNEPIYSRSQTDDLDQCWCLCTMWKIGDNENYYKII